MAVKANIIIDQGTDFTTTLNVTDTDGNPVDLTGYTGAAQIRKHYSSATSFDFEVATGNTSGEVVLSMNASVSNTIPYGRFVYDCELTDSSGSISRIVEGMVTISPQVTRL